MIAPLRTLVRNMRNLRVKLALVIIAVSLPGCDSPAEFAGPISEAGGIGHDARLPGGWYGLNENDDVICYLSIGVADDGMLRWFVTVIPVDPGDIDDSDSSIPSIIGAAWPSEINGKVYYNVRVDQSFGDVDPPFEVSGFIVIRAEFPDGDTLRLKTISSAFVAGLIRDGQLRGQVDERGVCVSSQVEIEGSELGALIEDHPEERLFQIVPLFAESDEQDFVFKRLKPTNPP